MFNGAEQPGNTRTVRELGVADWLPGWWLDFRKTAPECPIETSWARIVINKHRKFSFWGDAGEDAHQDREFLLLHAGKAPSPKLRERLAQKQQQSPAQCFQLGLFSRDTSQEKENQWGKGRASMSQGLGTSQEHMHPKTTNSSQAPQGIARMHSSSSGKEEVS